MLAEAEADIRKLVSLQPRNAEAHAELAVLCERSERGGEALEHHEEANRLAPGQPRYLNNLAFALLMRGRAKEAIPKLEEGLRIEPRSARLRNNLGYAHAATGDFTRAAEQFRLGGTPVQARNNLGFAYERSGNLAQAYDLYLQATRLDPADTTSRTNLSQVATRLGRSLPPEAAVPVRPVSEIGGS
jgi:Flp pilus assembly protein TadD